MASQTDNEYRKRTARCSFHLPLLDWHLTHSTATLSNLYLCGRCLQLGGFRTFMPGEAKREDEGDAEAASSQLLPAEKVNDFGAHWKQ